MAYVNKMGGVRLKKYNVLARLNWQWTEKRNIFLKATYIPSKENKDADRLSRILNPDTEWELSNIAFESIVNNFGSPEIDIFRQREIRSVTSISLGYRTQALYRLMLSRCHGIIFSSTLFRHSVLFYRHWKRLEINRLKEF